MNKFSNHIGIGIFTIFIMACFNLSHGQITDIKVVDLPVNKYGLDQKMSFGVPSGIIEDRFGYIWIARERGLVRFDGYNFKVYAAELPSPRCNRISEDEYGNLWIPTDVGFARYIRSSDNFEIFNPTADIDLVLKNVPMDTLPQKEINYQSKIGYVHPLNDSIVLLTSDMGVHYYNISQKRLDTTLFMIPEFAGKISFTNTTYTLSPSMKDPDSIWVGTRGGLGLLIASKHKFIPIIEKLSKDDKQIIKEPETDQFLYTEIQDQGGRLVMGSWGNGLVTYDKKSGNFERYWHIRKNSKCRLCENISFGLTFLNKNLVLSGGSLRQKEQETFPIKLYDLTEKSITNFNSDEFHPNKLADGLTYGTCIDRNGKIWINQYTAVCSSIDSFFKPTSPARAHLAISHIKVGNEHIEFDRDLSKIRHLQLNSEDENLEIGFNLINPKDPNSTNYSYKLDGHDKNWIETKTNRTARYERLKKNNYTFMVRAKENGHIIERSILTIEQKRAFLSNKSVRFISLGMITLLILLALYQRKARINQRDKLRSKFDRDLAELEMQGIRSQLNPHFLFNSLNSIKHFIQLGDNKTAALYLSKFSSLMRNTLNHSRSEMITLEEEMKSLKLFLELETMRFEGKFDFKIEIDPTLVKSKIQLPPMVLQPFAENAIWHGLLHKNTPGLLKIMVKKVSNSLEIVIQDDGIGRAKASELKSKSAERHKIQGLKITKDRMDILGKIYKEKTTIRIQDLFSKDQIAEGTRVTLNFPLQQTNRYESNIN